MSDPDHRQKLKEAQAERRLTVKIDLAEVLEEIDLFALAIMETETKERRGNPEFEKTNRARILEGKALACQTLRSRIEKRANA